MATGNKFFDDLPEKEQKQFAILFEDKTTWYVENQCNGQNWDILKLKKFDKALKSFIESQSNNYDLSYICFPMLNFDYFFLENTITGDISFENAVFCGETYFVQTIFEGITNFSETVFLDAVYFTEAKFYQKVNFNKSVFKKDAIFSNSIFKNKLKFTEVDFRENAYLNAKNMSFNKIDIEGIYLTDPILLGLTGFGNNKKISLSKDNFANKESARLIKAHFEKQNNITEANKYFVIEQEKYIEELRDKKNKHDGEKLTKLIPLCLNKWISNFGTDWVRAILFFMLWGIVAKSIFSALSGMWFWNLKLIIYFVLLFFIYWLTFKNTKASLGLASLLFLSIFLNLIGISNFFIETKTINEITIITNPINAFKDDETFKDYEAIGAIIRIISATIIYQIIVAFRQFTRRS